MEIISYNCHGYRGSIPFLTDILLKCDILCLQELMISKQDCHILNTCHCDYVCRIWSVLMTLLLVCSQVGRTVELVSCGKAL